MSLKSISSAALKDLLKLVERRDTLQSEISGIESEILAALDEKPSKTGPILAAKTQVIRKTKRGKRGALKESILAALNAAGKAGLSVKNLSSTLGVKNQNLHVWFHTTGKKIKELKKTGTGHWSLSS